MQISVLVTSFNRRKLFGKTWDSLMPQLDKNDELIIVEDGGDTGWHNGYLQKIDFPYKYVYTGNKEYRSCVYAKNIALKLASKELILINETEVVHHLPNNVEKMKKYIENNPNSFIVPKTMLFQRADLNYDKPEIIDDQMAPFIALVRRDELMAINGWDERFKYWGNDDNDLTYRLGMNGVKHISLDGVIGYHQYHSRPPQTALGNYNEDFLYEKNKSIVANLNKEWGLLMNNSLLLDNDSIKKL